MRVLYSLRETESSPRKTKAERQMRSHADAAIGSRGGSDLNEVECTSENPFPGSLTLRHELWLTGRWVVEGAKGLIALLIPQTQSRPLSGDGTIDVATGRLN